MNIDEIEKLVGFDKELVTCYESNQKQYMPAHTECDLKNYVEHGLRPGYFLESVLTNDLFGAYASADDINIANMFAVIKYIYSDVPSIAHGSKKRFESWIENRQKEIEEDIDTES